MIAYNIHTAQPVQRQQSPLEPGVWLMPAGATDIVPPEFDVQTQTCTFDGTEWIVAEIPQPEPEPTPEPLDPMELLRAQRDVYLTESDWRMTLDYPYDDQDAWRTYREELRQLPQQIEAGVISAPTVDENNLLIFDNWPVKPI